MRLAGKVAIVTGAASGIGKATAEIFAAEGAKVVAADYNVERLKGVVDGITAAGGTAIASQGNIADATYAEALVDLAVTTYGRLDVLVNNAGIMDYMQPVHEISDDIWRKVFAVNVDGPMYTMRRAVTVMLEQGSGSIVNVGSTASVSGGAAGAAYTATKHALLGLSRNTAWQYAKKGIRCNMVLPGGTATNIQESMPAERLSPTGGARAGEFAALIPQFMMPADIANVALFFASDESHHINGAIVAADGGWTSL
jgi:NAD(P)-dependent dehydrogenase (short-subunit alcohol dehydrogenase family)